MEMETILDQAIINREMINDFNAVLKLLWVDAAYIDDEQKAVIALGQLCY